MKIKRFITLLLSIILVKLCAANVSAVGYRDVPTNAWYAEGVRYVSERGIMRGTGSDRFGPYDSVSRGMAVTVLYRMEGSPTVAGNSFLDVKSDSYYADAITWAAAKGIVSGYSATSFGPEDPVTREQLAAILYRYEGYKGHDVSEQAELSRYTDADSISAYAKEAFSWANAVGLITGTSERTLSPQGNATRAQLATLIMRLEKTVFSDQKEEKTKTGSKLESNTHIKNHDEPVDTDKPTITVSSVTAGAGDSNVQVIVSVKNNPGILGMSLALTYDESEMTLETAANGVVLKRYLTMTKSKTLSSGCNFIWDGVDVSSEDIADGEILVLTFRIKDTAASGTYPISLSHQIGSIVDNNLAPVDVSIVNGSITVSE